MASSSLSRCNSMDAISAPKSSPRRRGLYISPATVKLNHLFEQNRQRQQKKDGAKVQEPAAAPQGKGKPRLLLMGQRRYESRYSSVVDGSK
jgi:Ras-related GTP-binding protein C/D